MPPQTEELHHVCMGAADLRSLNVVSIMRLIGNVCAISKSRLGRGGVSDSPRGVLKVTAVCNCTLLCDYMVMAAASGTSLMEILVRARVTRETGRCPRTFQLVISEMNERHVVIFHLRQATRVRK